MVVGSATLLVVNFILYIMLRSVNRWLAYIQTFLLFIFAFIVSNREFSVFYLLLFVIAILIAELNIKVRSEQQAGMIGGKFTTKGFTLIAISLVVGVLMYAFIAIISTRVGGQIVGVPNLAISSTSEIASMLKPTFEAHLGIIENFFVFTIFESLVVFGMMLPLLGAFMTIIPVVVPLFLTALMFGIFHVAAYSISLSLILWASLAFAIFILSWFFLKDSLAADTAHYLNNGVVSLGRQGLTLVGV